MAGVYKEKGLTSILRPDNKGVEDFHALKQQLMPWNYEHQLAKILTQLNMLENEEEIKILQRDYLSDFLTNLLETYSNPKRKSASDTPAQFYFVYMADKYKSKPQISRMCNAFAYSLQLYSVRSVELRHYYDFFDISRGCHREINFFSKARRAIVTYLQHSTSLDSIELQPEQWTALLSRIFSHNTVARDAVIDRIKKFNLVLPTQKYPMYS